MNKYELTVVISAKLEDEARLATLEKVKDMIARFGGTVTNVNDWGKKKLAYDIQKILSLSLMHLLLHLQSLRHSFVSWTAL